MNCPVDSEESPYERLIGVEKWQVTLHLIYDSQSGDWKEHAVSDWTCTLEPIDAATCPGEWTGEADVKIEGVTEFHINDGDHRDPAAITAKGSEKYWFGLKVHKDGYEFSQGYCNTQFGTRTIYCPKRGESSDDGTITYSQPWRVKVPLPEQGTTLSGSATITPDSPGQSGGLPKGAVVTVKWEFRPVGQKELKYGETAMDVAAMIYTGTAIDPHIFISQAGGGSSWIPHANFAGEVWVDGVNKVKIHRGPVAQDAQGRPQHVTSEYMIQREARSWDLDKPGQSPWHPDSPDPIQDWIDNAAISFDAGPPPKWNRRVMDEFLVQVLGHPEIGRVYAAFVMETRKNAYRIRYSAPKHLSEEQYDAIKASAQPFFPYPFTGKDDGWVKLVQDRKTKQWKSRPPGK